MISLTSRLVKRSSWLSIMLEQINIIDAVELVKKKIQKTRNMYSYFRFTLKIIEINQEFTKKIYIFIII